MKDQKIIANAPEGATDIDDVNKYWAYQGNGDYYLWDGGKWIESWSPFHTRSLADIGRILELEKALLSTNKELHLALCEINTKIAGKITSIDLDCPDYWDCENCHLNQILLAKEGTS
jgi:hypothetical protein